MAQVLDELVLSLGIDDRDFTAGEQAVHAVRCTGNSGHYHLFFF